MRLPDIQTDQQLWDFMTTPSDGLIACLARIDGAVMALGGSGKMGSELVGMIRRADAARGRSRAISVASTFSNPDGTDRKKLEALDVTCLQGDLSDEVFLSGLPDAPLVIYMMGFKFGSAGDWRRAFHLNAVTPYLVGRQYPRSRIVVFSSGNPYPHTDPTGGGSRESDVLAPHGIYGWCIVARESAFATTALQSPEQRTALYRLCYAQHLCYGVLVDLAAMIRDGEPISLAMPAVNLVSQRDANDAALRSLAHCANAPWILNVAGPICRVRDLGQALSDAMGLSVTFIDDEADTALVSNDDKCRQIFGPYRDSVDDMIAAAAHWVQQGGTSWHKPTMFGRVRHDY